MKWRYVRPLLQAPLLIIGVVMIFHGLFGPKYFSQEPGNHVELGAFSRSFGPGAAMRGKSLLPGLSFYAGAPGGAKNIPSAMGLAASSCVISGFQGDYSC